MKTHILVIVLFDLIISCFASDLCGISSVDNQLSWRIIGGQDATPNSWPWMASIRLKISPTFRVCGATLVNKNWIITAAHCLQVDDNPLNWLVVFDGTNTTDTKETARAVSKIVVHPKASIGNSIFNDIALIKLNKSLDLKGTDHNLIPICLPKTTDSELNSIECIITGWGRLRVDGQHSNVLQEAKVPIINSSVCFELFGFRIDINTNLCAGGLKKGGLGTCTGDSGGPLQCRLANKQWYQFGIISWGTACAKPSIPDVFTKVSAYYDWIQEIIN